jgi:transposase InsO family protein
MAIWRRGKPDALHSDRGSQYTSEPFQRLMAEHGVTCSMSRGPRCQIDILWVGYVKSREKCFDMQCKKQH